MDTVEGYEIGQRPPKLEDDGSFVCPLPDIRMYGLVDGDRRILIVDKTTGLLIEDSLED